MIEAAEREREEGREKWKERKRADVELLRGQGKQVLWVRDLLYSAGHRF